MITRSDYSVPYVEFTIGHGIRGKDTSAQTPNNIICFMYKVDIHNLEV